MKTAKVGTEGFEFSTYYELQEEIDKEKNSFWLNFLSYIVLFAFGIVVWYVLHGRSSASNTFLIKNHGTFLSKALITFVENRQTPTNCFLKKQKV